MKIVIDIPDDDYEYIKLLHEGLTDYQTTLKLYRAVKNGTVEERPQGEWEDYSEDFYKCPECGYLLNKLCPQCHNTVILPKGDADMKEAENE